MKSNRHNTLSRRSMMLASGTAVVAGLASTQLVCASSFDKNDSEIEYWTDFVGQQFTATLENTGRGYKDKAVRVELKLIDVVDFTSLDPNRPRILRAPFCLRFVLGREVREFQSGNYILANRKLGRPLIFMNEVMDMETGDFVIEAIFG